jgi:hypothetical protein
MLTRPSGSTSDDFSWQLRNVHVVIIELTENQEASGLDLNMAGETFGVAVNAVIQR